MNLAWQSYLQNLGAVIQDGRVVNYGNAPAELERTRSGTVLADLSHFGLIHFSGDDAQSFLQGQLSCDVKETNSSAGGASALYGSYCNPKGRMLASFLMWQDSGGYAIQLPSTLRATIQKRLSMYILRAKVRPADSSDILVRFGIAGDHAEASVQKILGMVPGLPLSVTRGQQGSVIRLAQDRFELVIAPEQAPLIWEHLSKDAMPVGASCWDWLEIRSGIPVITAAIQEQFVPQMVNLEAIGGVSFQKGCYPGQEIVARAQYLGKIKRRMFLANIQLSSVSSAISATSVASITAGDELFSTDMGEQSSGMVVNAAPAPEGGFDVLAVIQTKSVETGKIHWKFLEGPPLEIMPLPYLVNI